MKHGEIGDPLIHGLLKKCEGAYSQRTLSGYRNDLKLFISWCEKRHHDWLPATPQSIAGFVDEQSKACAITTVKRRVEAIKFAHRMNDLPSPVANSCVALALRRASRSNTARPRQSVGLTHRLLQQILTACPRSLSGHRDAALLSVGYDALARSSELAMITVENLVEDRDTLIIPRAKNDRAGQGRHVHLSPRSRKLLFVWLQHSKIRKGPLFQGLHTGVVSGRALETSSIRRLVKSAAKRASLEPEVIAGLSGHSMRIGAAQDMMVAGLDYIAIMQAGGWTSVDVVARYVENAATQSVQERRWRALNDRLVRP